MHKNLDLIIIKTLNKRLNKQKNDFADKEFNYLLEADFNTSYFYGLPKIHKVQSITKAIKNKILKPLKSTNRRT